MTDIRKILAVAVVIAMACASIIIVSPNNTVTAEDSAKPLADLNTGWPGSMDKVAWHSDGSYALGILTGSDQIYKYTRQTMSWALEYNLAGGSVFRDIKYSSNFGYFYIVGEVAGVQPMAWSYYEPTQNLVDLGAPYISGAYFNALTLADEDGATNFAFLAVGYEPNTLQGYASWYNQVTMSWTDVTTGWLGNHELLDATWDHGFGGIPYWAVGVNASSGEGVVYSFSTVGNNKVDLIDTTGWGVTFGALYAIDWRPAGLADHAVMAGDNFGEGNAFAFDGFGVEVLLNNTDTYKDVSWHPDGSMAMLVGFTNVSDGVINHYYPDAYNSMKKMSVDGYYGNLYGVDVKGWTSPSSGLIVGSAGAVGSYLSAADSGTTLTVNAAFPHMYAIDMWKTSDGTETSTLNTQVDIDEIYTFYTEVNYTIAGVDELFDGNNNTFIDLTAWYDEGNDLLAMPASDDTHRTKKFVARFFEDIAGPAGVTGTIVYPTGSPGTNEVTLDSVGCSGPYGADNRYGVWINVSFGLQMRAAAGPFGGASGDIYDSGNSFNGANSWNIEMEVYDNDFPGASNTTYEEFGVFTYTNISIAGNPSGNAPPGSNSNAMAPNSQIIYSANTPYYVNVSIPDLTSGANSIAATYVNISLVGAYPAGFDYEPYTEINASWGTYGRPFAGADSERMVWGNETLNPSHLIAPTDNGTYAHGPWGSDFNGYGATEVNWWVSVPGGTPEGIYQATITFKIGFY